MDEPAAQTASLLARGATVGRYLIVERLGAGAMGVVYAAYDPELDRKVALKLLRPDARGRRDEAGARRAWCARRKAIAKLSHPNVVGIFDVGVHEGRVFLAMEYLPRRHAARRGSRRSAAAGARSSTMFIEVGRGLAAAHARGPGPPRLQARQRPARQDTARPKIVDFGLVRVLGARSEVDGGGPARARPRRAAGGGGAIADAHAHRRADRHAGLHGARAVPRAGRRRAQRSVRVLRGAVRGALRRAPVRGRDAGRAGRVGDDRDACASRPKRQRRPGLGARRRLARARPRPEQRFGLVEDARRRAAGRSAGPHPAGVGAGGRDGRRLLGVAAYARLAKDGPPPGPPPLCAGVAPSTSRITGPGALAAKPYGYAAPGLSQPIVQPLPLIDDATPGVQVTFAPENATGWAGFGLAFAGCVDASAYTGVRFTVAGDLGTCALNFGVVPTQQQPTAFGGACAGECIPPFSAPLPLGTSTVAFADLTGGYPEGPVDQTRLQNVQWSFKLLGEAVRPAGPASR